MRKLAIATVALLASVGTAQAKCGTSALEGDWLIQQYGIPNVILLKVKNGNILINGAKNATIRQRSNCKVILNNGVESISGWSEYISQSSSRKPRVIDLGSKSAGVFMMVRKP